MELNGFPGENTILSYKLTNGVGWLTTHRLIIQQEKHNLRLNIMERQDPEMHLLTDFEKAEIKGETLGAEPITVFLVGESYFRENNDINFCFPNCMDLGLH